MHFFKEPGIYCTVSLHYFFSSHFFLSPTYVSSLVLALRAISALEPDTRGPYFYSNNATSVDNAEFLFEPAYHLNLNRPEKRYKHIKGSGAVTRFKQLVGGLAVRGKNLLDLVEFLVVDEEDKEKFHTARD